MTMPEDLSDSIEELLDLVVQDETDDALIHIDRIGKSINAKTFNTIVACGCGPSGERGVEDGLCPI